jgi:hypothetical protein
MILGDWDFEKIHAGQKYIAELNNGKRHSLSIDGKYSLYKDTTLAGVSVS